MRKLVWLVLGLLAGCGTTSYGADTHGVFPPRAAGADYPNWEHQCVVVTNRNATEVLADSGAQGWELVAHTVQNGNDLWCFKRPKPVR
jgi:hypothetical protein